MAPFASGPAPRREPGSARIQFMESGPPDGIELRRARQQQPSCVHRPSCGPPPSSVRRPSSQRPSSSRRPCGRPSSVRPSWRPRPSCGRSSSPQPSSVRPCVRPSSSDAAFLRPPARIASASARGCSVVGVSSLLTCRNSFSCRWLQSRGRSATGPAILRGMSSATRASAAHARKRDEPARRTSAPSCFVASAIPHPTSMLDRLCFTWTGLRSMDRPSVDVRNASILRIGCTRTESAIPCLAYCCQQKATVSSQVR